MKTTAGILAICLTIFSFQLCRADEKNPIFVQGTSFDQVANRAQFLGKPVILLITTKDCPSMRNFTNKVLSDSTVQRIYGRNFMAYRVDVESAEGKKLASRYNALILPQIIYFSPDKNIIFKSHGTDDPKKAIEEATNVLNVVKTHQLVKNQALKMRNISYLNRKVQKKAAIAYAKKDAKEGKTDAEKQVFEYTLNSEELRFFKKHYVKTLTRYN
jgi:thioredoxin-related protein